MRDAAVRAVYAMPTLHNPLGWVMSASARARLVAIARRHGLLIIEDASYAYLAEEPPPPLAALAPDITVYVSGLSKSVATGLRVGFVAAPAALVPAIERAIRATTWNTPAITTAIACRWLDDGTVAASKPTSGMTRRRGSPSPATFWRACRRSAIPRPTSSGCRCPGRRADRIAASLAREHISVSTAEPFADVGTRPAGDPPRPGLRRPRQPAHHAEQGEAGR